MPPARKVIDLTGQQFDRLTVLHLSQTRPGGSGRHAFWVCRCVCGNTTEVSSHHLRVGQIKSCGCLFVEGTNRYRLHGRTNTREFAAWTAIRKRCYDPNASNYSIYGGRGITVCDRWRDDFAAFYADMGTCPPGHSLDRKDNEGPYSTDNCRWANARTQANNRSNNRRLSFNGIERTVTEWARTMGIQKSALFGRLRSGWPIERALTEPIQPRR